MVDAHEVGTASEVRLAKNLGGVVNDGGAEAIAKLKRQAPSTSGSTLGV